MSRRILALAWPSIATNVTTPLMAMVDLTIVGHIGGMSYIGAVAIGGAMFNMLYWLTGFLRMGTSGFTANAHGGNDRNAMSGTLARALMVSMFLSLPMILFSGAIADVMQWFLAPDSAEVSDKARTYFATAIWGAPAVLATYVLSGWFTGMQDTRPILLMAIVQNVLNIAISLMLVYSFDMGLTGVAAGTAISQWIGAGIGLMISTRLRQRLLLPSLRKSIRHTGITLRHYFRVNGDIFLRTLCLAGVTMWFTRQGAHIGTDILAANALMMQLFMLFSFFMDGFAFAGEALAGHFHGAGDSRSLHRCVRSLHLWGLGLSIAASLLYCFGGIEILRLLTDDIAVINTASHYIHWIAAVPICGYMAFIWDGIFIGLTMTRAMLTSMAIAMIVFFGIDLAMPIVAPALFGISSNDTLWMAFDAYLLCRGIVQSIIYATKKN